MDNNSLASARKPVRVLDGPLMLIICAVVVAILIILGFLGLPNNTLRYFFKIFLYIVMGSMWNLMSGFTGMTSLGQQVFVGLAGYSVCVMTTTCGMSFWMGILCAAVIGVVFSLLLSTFLFRMRGMYFAIATWVVAEAICTWFKSWEFVQMGSGMKTVTRPKPTTLDVYIWALTLFVIAMVVVYVLLRTKTGLGLTAMRDDTDAASSLGVNIVMSKRLVYIIAALFTALAGALYWINSGTIYPDSGFDINWTVAMVFIVIVGGIGTVAGPIVGAIIYVVLSEVLAKFPGWSNIILGAIAILVIVFLPDGVMGTLQKKLRFDIFSQKRFSEPKAKNSKKAA
ncbi:MAG: branched-chain amino acid ABC transporter permease [Parasporobacterium sp.]|nr:branched-chain amino acid ABC transporter permease [Parasporobacterium sp.]